jgi:hypothetical protein
MSCTKPCKYIITSHNWSRPQIQLAHGVLPEAVETPEAKPVFKELGKAVFLRLDFVMSLNDFMHAIHGRRGGVRPPPLGKKIVHQKWPFFVTTFRSYKLKLIPAE